MGEVTSRVGRGQTVLNVYSLKVGAQVLLLNTWHRLRDDQETKSSLISSFNNLILYIVLNPDPAVLLVQEQGWFGNWTKNNPLNYIQGSKEIT